MSFISNLFKRETTEEKNERLWQEELAKAKANTANLSPEEQAKEKRAGILTKYALNKVANSSYLNQNGGSSRKLRKIRRKTYRKRRSHKKRKQ